MSQPYVRMNRRNWNASADEYQRKHGAHMRANPLSWGNWAAPEAEVRALPSVFWRDVLELGCGGGAASRAIADMQCNVVAFDVSERQLAHVGRSDHVRVVQGDAELLPFADESFDIVFCDHGALSWTDPYRTVPQVARVLRSGGYLVFNAATSWGEICWDEETNAQGLQLRRPYFGLHRVEREDGGAHFCLTYGEWVRLFVRNDMLIDDLIELRPREDATSGFGWGDPDWARKWPAEHIWRVRKKIPPPFGPELVVRACTAADVPVIDAHRSDQRAQRFFADQERRLCVYLVAWLDGRAVGNARLNWPEAKRAGVPGLPEIGNLDADARLQNRGIGTRLVNEATRIAFERGFDAVCIGVDKPNVDALRLYRRLGFEDWGPIGDELFLLKHKRSAAGAREPGEG